MRNGGRIAASPRMRNGGRHCCQPPLRRDLGLPVFVPVRGLAAPTVADPWLTCSGVASVPSAASHAGSPVPCPAGLPPCGKQPGSDRFCRSGSASLAGSRTGLGCPRTRPLPALALRPLPSLPEFPDRTWLLAVPGHRSSSRGPSWTDRSCRRTGLVPKDPSRPATRGRSALPAPLADIALRRSFASGPASWGTGSFANSTPAPSPAEIGNLSPFRSVPASLRSQCFPAGAAAPDHPCRMIPLTIRTKLFRQLLPCGKRGNRV